MKNLLATCLSLLLVSPSMAFTLATTDILQKGWATHTPLQFFINRNNCPENINELLNSAMNVWNSIPYSALQVQLGADSSTTPTTLLEGDATEVPLITCDPDFSTTLTLDGDLIAGVGFLRGTNFRPISNGGLILNVEDGKNGNLNELSKIQSEVVIAHEIGHVLGLGHSADTESLMYYSVGSKQNLALSLDDQNGVSFLYPRDELKNLELFGGCASIRPSSGAGQRNFVRSESIPWWNGNSIFLLSAIYFFIIFIKHLTRKKLRLQRHSSHLQRLGTHGER